MGVTLKVIGGPHLGKEYEFREHDSFIVGRGKQAHFRLPRDDQYFSRAHFMVEVNPPLCRLTDLASRNGTKVNGTRVSAVDLQDGDQIAAGKTLLQVRVTAEPAAASPTDDAHLAATVISRADVQGEESRPVELSMTAESCGLEILGPDDDADLRGPVPDPHGYLPKDYLGDMRTQAQPIAGYRIVREIGRGGMGRVFLAVRQSDLAIVALKTILPGTVTHPRDQQRFLREADILRQLLHPNIVAYRDCGECDGLLYFSMEYVAGHGANALVKGASEPLPIARGVRIILSLLTALRYAHAEGFVHRDIKPSNLLITESAGGDGVKLADFGLARAYQASGMSGLTMTGEISGTIAYMSPEQITDFRRAQPATDQYAAAATLYYLLTSRFVHDFPDDPGKRLLLILDKEPVPIRERRAEIAEGLAAAIHKGLARDPQARFKDVREFYAAIEPYGRGGG